MQLRAYKQWMWLGWFWFAASNLCSTGHAASITSSAFDSDLNPRASNKFGIYAGALSEPYLSVASINFAYHVVPYVRAQMGIGTNLFGETMGVGLKWVVYPQAHISPVIGFNASYMNPRNIKGFDDALGRAIGQQLGLDPTLLSSSRDFSSWMGSINAGLDWVTPIGFHVGAGVQILVLSSNAQYRPSNGVASWNPYFNLGWFF